MTNQKQSSKRQSIVIAILAVLLVGMLAFNITYAFFTDKETNTDDFKFGTITLKAQDGNVIDVYRQGAELNDPVMPGDVIKGAFSIDLEDTSEAAYIRYQLTASAKYKYLYNEDSETLDKTGAYPVVAYIDGEFIQAEVSSSTVSVYAGNGATALDPVADAELIEALRAFDTFVKYTDDKGTPATNDDVVYTITFAEDTTATPFIDATITIEGVEDESLDNELKLSTNAAAVKAILAEATENATRKVAIDAAVAALNGAIKGTSDATGTDTPVMTSYTAFGDGYIYRNAIFGKETPAEAIAISYTLPIELGNALQDVTINMDLVVEAVQAANVDAVDAGQVNFGGYNYAEKAGAAADAIKMFYAAEHAHGGIQEA